MPQRQTGRNMEKENFYRLMDPASVIAQETTNQLRDLIVKHPYFQGARVLLLKNLKSISDPNLNTEIQNQAGLIANRQHLYKILNPSKPIASTTYVVDEKVEDTPPAKPKAKTRKTTKAKDTSFILLEGNNHTDAKTINAEANPNNSDTDILELISESDNNAINNTNDSQNSNNLIEAFLIANPKIERPSMPKPDETFENEDISTNSIAEPEEVASEPLAKIFIAQGYFEKAIAVYEKLCLKYPEKNSYFADQIQKIKEQINSKH